MPPMVLDVAGDVDLGVVAARRGAVAARVFDMLLKTRRRSVALPITCTPGSMSVVTRMPGMRSAARAMSASRSLMSTATKLAASVGLA